MSDASDTELGSRFWLPVMGVVVGGLIAAFVLFIIVGGVWYAWGFFGAFLFVTAALLTVAWFYDRRQKKRYLAG